MANSGSNLLSRFGYDSLLNSVPDDIVVLIRMISEARAGGREIKSLYPKEIEMARSAARASSVRFSNEIEGVSIPENRMMEVMGGTTEPRGRHEQEIAGYRDAIDDVYLNGREMGMDEGTAIRLHREVFSASRPCRRGR